MRPALDLYHRRCDLFRRVCQLDPNTLERACRTLAALGPDELQDLLAYAEGLAAWSPTSQESKDAAIPQPGTQTSRAGTGSAG